EAAVGGVEHGPQLPVGGGEHRGLGGGLGAVGFVGDGEVAHDADDADRRCPDLAGPAQPFEGADERVGGQPVASQSGGDPEVEPGRDARALGGGEQTVYVADRRVPDLVDGPHRLVDVGGR